LFDLDDFSNYMSSNYMISTVAHNRALIASAPPPLLCIRISNWSYRINTI